ncbi:MAG: hypothetical protein WDO18_16145 [Acidobacteriota bacterium]
MYLPEETVKDVLRWIAQQAAGSTLVFDFTYRSAIDFFLAVKGGMVPPNDYTRVSAERLLQLEKWGEPWTFGVPDDKAAEFVEALGLKHVRNSFDGERRSSAAVFRLGFGHAVPRTHSPNIRDHGSCRSLKSSHPIGKGSTSQSRYHSASLCLKLRPRLRPCR